MSAITTELQLRVSGVAEAVRGLNQVGESAQKLSARQQFMMGQRLQGALLGPLGLEGPLTKALDGMERLQYLSAAAGISVADMAIKFGPAAVAIAGVAGALKLVESSVSAVTDNFKELELIDHGKIDTLWRILSNSPFDRDVEAGNRRRGAYADVKLENFKRFVLGRDGDWEQNYFDLVRKMEETGTKVTAEEMLAGYESRKAFAEWQQGKNDFASRPLGYIDPAISDTADRIRKFDEYQRNKAEREDRERERIGREAMRDMSRDLERGNDMRRQAMGMAQADFQRGPQYAGITLAGSHEARLDVAKQEWEKSFDLQETANDYLRQLVEKSTATIIYGIN